jgi:hypothetical protein
MIKVTFDTNVWRKVSLPNDTDHATDPLLEYYQKIHEAIKTAKIAAYIAEVIFTLEGIEGKDRQSFMKSYEADIDCVIDETPSQDEMIELSLTIAPNIKAHLGNNHYLSKYLREALKIGFKILRCPRVGGIINPDIDKSFYAHLENIYSFAECAEEIERIGGGISHVMRLGNLYSNGNKAWRFAIMDAPSTDSTKIKKALAEWADGDMIGAHYAYKNDYLCTLDDGKTAGSTSVMSAQNKDILKAKFGIKFIHPEELCDLIV